MHYLHSRILCTMYHSNDYNIVVRSIFCGYITQQEIEENGLIVIIFFFCVKIF